MSETVHPTHTDGVVASVSAGVGGPSARGPAGTAGGHRCGSCCALAALTFALGMVQKSACYEDTWTDGTTRYTQMCYSDLPYLYTGRGFAELAWPYRRRRGRAQSLRGDGVPGRHRLLGLGHRQGRARSRTARPTSRARHSEPTSEVAVDRRGAARDRAAFVIVNALGFAVLVAARRLAAREVEPAAALGRRRCSPPSPALAAHRPGQLGPGGGRPGRRRLVGLGAGPAARCTGVLIGLGAATKLYPLFLLGAVLVICLRDRGCATSSWRPPRPWRPGCWPTLPAYLLRGPEEWKVFWTFNSDRGRRPRLGLAGRLSRPTDGIDRLRP